jgi:hypothetical protein
MTDKQITINGRYTRLAEKLSNLRALYLTQKSFIKDDFDSMLNAGLITLEEINSSARDYRQQADYISKYLETLTQELVALDTEIESFLSKYTPGG